MLCCCCWLLLSHACLCMWSRFYCGDSDAHLHNSDNSRTNSNQICARSHVLKSDWSHHFHFVWAECIYSTHIFMWHIKPFSVTHRRQIEGFSFYFFKSITPNLPDPNAVAQRRSSNTWSRCKSNGFIFRLKGKARKKQRKDKCHIVRACGNSKTVFFSHSYVK